VRTAFVEHISVYGEDARVCHHCLYIISLCVMEKLMAVYNELYYKILQVRVTYGGYCYSSCISSMYSFVTVGIQCIFWCKITLLKNTHYQGFLVYMHQHSFPSVLWRCWLGGRKNIRPVKNWVMGCWRGYLSGARYRLAYGQSNVTATHCLLFQ